MLGAWCCDAKDLAPTQCTFPDVCTCRFRPRSLSRSSSFPAVLWRRRSIGCLATRPRPMLGSAQRCTPMRSRPVLSRSGPTYASERPRCPRDGRRRIRTAGTKGPGVRDEAAKNGWPGLVSRSGLSRVRDARGDYVPPNPPRNLGPNGSVSTWGPNFPRLYCGCRRSGRDSARGPHIKSGR